MGGARLQPINLRNFAAAVLFAGSAVGSFGTDRAASASALMVVTCSAPTGLNIASDIEPNQPKDSVTEVYDPEAKGYVSHPRKTQSAIITLDRAGTASQTSISENGTSMVTNMRIVGTINSNAITLIEGENGFVNLLTLYPKESIAIFAGTSYFGWNKSIPTGYAYVSHCKFSNVMH